MEELYYALNPWWETKPFDFGIIRDFYLQSIDLTRKQIEIITGSRRIGKTTLMKQLIHRLIDSGTPPKQILYLALDHPRFALISISDLLKYFRKLHLHDRSAALFLFLDEVQDSPNWEVELKSIYDFENLKIICSGSTASLIKSQGSKLTGRQIITTLFPLSYEEFFLFRKENISPSEPYKHEKLVEDYLQTGGYPEHVINPSPLYLQNLLDDILARDLIRLFPIRKAGVLKDLLLLLSSSVGSRTSFNKLARVLGISVDTTKEYISYLEAAFLIRSISKWSTSYTDRVYAAKKIYFMDTGLKTLLTGERDMGAKAENAVLVHLLRNNLTSGYFAESEREVDFVIGGVKNPIPLEVKYTSDFDLEDRKFAGVKLFLRRYPETERTIVITKDGDKEFPSGKTIVQFIPLWKFLQSPLNLPVPH